MCFSEDSESKSVELFLPIDLKYFIDTKILLSASALGFITCASAYDELDDSYLRSYLDNNSEESEEAMNHSALEQIVNGKLIM